MSESNTIIVKDEVDLTSEETEVRILPSTSLQKVICESMQTITEKIIKAKYFCPMCNHKIHTIPSFWEHYKTIHGIGDKQLPSERVIEAGFTVLQRKIKDIYTPFQIAQKYNCTICKATFEHESWLRYHRQDGNCSASKNIKTYKRKIKEMSFTCIHCKVGFKEESLLKAHKCPNNMQKYKKSFLCRKCNQQNDNEVSQRFHELSHSQFWSLLDNNQKSGLYSTICFSPLEEQVIQCPMHSCLFMAPFNLTDFEEHVQSSVHKIIKDFEQDPLKGDEEDDPDKIVMLKAEVKFEPEDVEFFELPSNNNMCPTSYGHSESEEILPN